MTHRTNSRKANGHAGPNGRPNGHGPASTERGGHAASDDASGFPSANAAALAAAESTDRKAYAEVAPPPPNGAPRQVSAANNANNDKEKSEREVRPGRYPLPDNPGEFVEEIHRKVDLTEIWHGLLRSKDEKVRQRAAERLTDLLYKGAATSSEEPQQIIFDLPRPKRD